MIAIHRRQARIERCPIALWRLRRSPDQAAATVVVDAVRTTAAEVAVEALVKEPQPLHWFIQKQERRCRALRRTGSVARRA